MAKILSKFGEQQLVMVNYACGFNQSETGKYFERIIITFIVGVSLEMIATIAIDRYLAVHLRLKYHELVKLSRVVCILVIEWIGLLVFGRSNQ